MFLCFLITAEWVGARFPTYKYFPLQAEYTEVDVKEPIVQACYEYGKNISRQFLDDFSGPHAITLIHAWKRVNETTGDFYAVEVMRLRIRYVITVNVPEPNKFFLHSVRILNEETASGAHWFEPDEQTLELALAGVRKEYGEVKLRNVAVFKTLMKVKWIGQMVIDVEKDDERMLLDISIGKQFGAKEALVESIRRIY
jgi:hypothetical protein